MPISSPGAQIRTLHPPRYSRGFALANLQLPSMARPAVSLRSSLSALRAAGSSLARFMSTEAGASQSAPHRQPPPKDHLAYDIPDSSFPKGFLASGVHCGIKKKTVNDLGLIVSTAEQTSSAACYTKNVFKAAPVLVTRDVLYSSQGRAAAVVVNSGCANAVTGKQGMEDARDMARTVDTLRHARVAPESSSSAGPPRTLVMSTGVIGQTLPITNVLNGIALAHANLGSNFASWSGAAQAFMTTDTFMKLRARTFTLGGKKVRIAGIDKGAGMIHPNMGPPHATLLGVICTDAAIAPTALQTALTYAVERSFNSISVDGDMSTNDTIIAFANGASGMEREIAEDTDPEQYKEFRAELTSFATELAKLVVRDGEGATKFVTVSVEVSTSLTVEKTVSDISIRARRRSRMLIQ